MEDGSVIDVIFGLILVLGFCIGLAWLEHICGHYWTFGKTIDDFDEDNPNDVNLWDILVMGWHKVRGLVCRTERKDGNAL